MAEASWPCPNPQCSGFLDKKSCKRVLVDDRTGKEIGLTRDWGWVKLYRNTYALVGAGIWFPLFIVSLAIETALSHGNASHSSGIISGLGFFGGLAIYIICRFIGERRRKEALAYAVWDTCCRCTLCRRWWLIPEHTYPDAPLVDGSNLPTVNV